MSWDSYIQDQLLATKCIKHAIICGHDGNIWAQSKEITVSLFINLNQIKVKLVNLYLWYMNWYSAI